MSFEISIENSLHESYCLAWVNPIFDGRQFGIQVIAVPV